jgi:hypothetical protein
VVARSISKHPGSGVLFLDPLLRGTVLSRALLQTTPGVFLFDPARQEGLSGDNSGDGIGLPSWKFKIDADLLDVSVAAIALLFQFSD